MATGPKGEFPRATHTGARVKLRILIIENDDLMGAR